MSTVLLIDDDRFILATVGELLSSAGFQVLTAQDPDEVFKMDLSAVAAILCDYTMPGMNGAELLMTLRELGHSSAPFIFLTGHSEMDDLLPTAIRYSAELLPKPVDPAELMRLLGRLLPAAA